MCSIISVGCAVTGLMELNHSSSLQDTERRLEQQRTLESIGVERGLVGLNGAMDSARSGAQASL